VSVTEERFEPIELDDDAFGHSLGVNQGTPPEQIEVRFEPELARFVSGRVWHPSQEIRAQPDGSIVVMMRVSNDWALRSWILGFGCLARVLSPPGLVRQIADELERARRGYALNQ
jgi:predicted DNA-binding transcriptional regulator YafY